MKWWETLIIFHPNTHFFFKNQDYMTVKLVYFLKLFYMARIKLFTVNLVMERNSPLHLLETNVAVGLFSSGCLLKSSME